MPVTTRSQSSRKTTRPEGHSAETAQSATYLSSDYDYDDNGGDDDGLDCAAPTPTSTSRTRRGTVATTETATENITITIAEATSSRAVRKGIERTDYDASRSSLSSRPGSSAAPTSDKDNIDTRSLEPEADQFVNDDRAASSSNASSSRGVTTRSVRGVKRSGESNTTASTSSGTRSINNRMRNRAAGAAPAAAGNTKEDTQGAPSGQDLPRRSLLPQPSSISITPTRTKNRTPSGNLPGLKLQLATKTAPGTSSPAATATAKNKVKSTLASLTRLSVPSKKNETKNGFGLDRSMNLPSSSRASEQKPSSVRSDERLSRTERDERSSSTPTLAGKGDTAGQPETPKSARETPIKRLNSISSLKPRQQYGHAQSRSLSKLPTAPSSTPLARASSLRQPTASRLVLSSKKAPTQLQQQQQQSNTLQSRSELNGNSKKAPMSSKTIPTSSSALKETSRSVPMSQPLGALQTELLQLYLFYERAAERTQKEKDEAGRKLRQRYQNAAHRYEIVRGRELAEQRYLNINAVDCLEKSDEDGEDTFATRIKSLSRAIQSVSNLTHPSSGRYTNCVQEFERWMKKVESLRISHGRGQLPNLKIPCSRTSDVDKTPPATSLVDATQPELEHNIQYPFAEPLSQDWDTNVTGLRTELAQIADEFEKIDIALELRARKVVQKYERGASYEHSSPPSSALFRTVGGHRNLVISMIDELDMIKDIEADVMAVEKDWLRCEADRLIAARDVYFADRPTDHIGNWRNNANPISN